MGEPQPGDFPSPTDVKTDNVLMKADQIGRAGDYVRADNSADPVNFEVVNTTLIGTDGVSVIGGGIEQLQQAVVSTGIADNLINAACFGPGSWQYSKANGKINPNDYTMLSRQGTQFGYENMRKIKSSAAAVASSTLTITTATDHHFKVGDRFSLSGFTPTVYNDDYIVVSITDHDTFTAAAGSAAGSVTVQGTIDIPVTAEFAHAQFIKKSGGTYNQGAIKDDVCVMSVLKGGQTTS